MQLRFLSTAVLCAVLAACGGGSSSDASSTSTTSGSTGSAGSTSSTGTSGGTSASSGTSTSGSTSSSTTLLSESQYDVYAFGAGPKVSGAGALSSTGVLTLDASHSTTLAVTNTSDWSMSASGYTVLNRNDGAVIQLCNTASATNNTPYIALATASTQASTTATVVTSAAEVYGKTFYPVKGCSYLRKSDKGLEGQSSAHTASSFAFLIGADGSVSNNANNNSFPGSALTTLVSGQGLTQTDGTQYLTFYKYTASGQTVYFGVSRWIGSASGDQEQQLWLPN